MPDWFDMDSFATPSRGPYRFATVPKFWAYLEQKAEEGVIASPEMVLRELLAGEDQLKVWAKQQTKLFRAPDPAVQAVLRQVATSVTTNPRFLPHHSAKFLAGADPWLVAHAKASGGRIVTFEKSEPTARKPKIPDVAATFGVKCLNLWDWLTEAGASF